MSVENGGYSQDKKFIEQCFEQNDKDHDDMAKQNTTEHLKIEKILSEIKETYCPDVIVLKTQVKIIGTTLLVVISAILGLITKAIISWVEK